MLAATPFGTASPPSTMQMRAQLLAALRHRDVVGGMWDDIGKLQFDFLCDHGLRPSCRLIDIGCGCLRGLLISSRSPKPEFITESTSVNLS
jgi:hypothetical protein